MNIIKRPFGELDDFFPGNEDDNWFFPVFSKNMYDPDVDVYETEKDVVAKASIPDINPDDVKVSIEDNVLKISGDFEKKDKEDKGRNYWKREIKKGSFSRSLRLPAEVDEDKADASYNKGVLEIVVPKKEPEKRKEKEIKVKSK